MENFLNKKSARVSGQANDPKKRKYIQCLDRKICLSNNFR